MSELVFEGYNSKQILYFTHKFALFLRVPGHKALKALACEISHIQLKQWSNHAKNCVLKQKFWDIKIPQDGFW